jgi:4-amino-4-deoxy-L-arabinose transferase
MPAAAMPLSRRLPWLLAFLLLSLGAWGSRPLWEPDEGRYGESAREMAVGGDWLVPRLRGEPHLTKPPMTYWLAALGLRLTGVGPDQPAGNAWGARLPVALGFFGAILAVVALGRAWGWSDREAHLAGLIFGSAALPFGAGHVLTTDMLLTFFELLVVLAAWRVWNAQGAVAAWRWVFWIAIALAFLTKGPPGLLPLLALIVYRRLDPAPPRARLFSRPGFALCLILGLAWYVAIVIRMPDQFKAFIVDEVFHRIASDEQNRSKAFWFYFAVVPLGIAPWLFLWPDFLRGLWRRLKPGGEGSGEGGFWRRLGRRVVALSPPAKLSLLWFGLSIAVFQLSVSKMPLYVVPLFPPLALWFARLHLRKFPEGWPAHRIARPAMILLAVVWIAALCIGVTLPDNSNFGDSFVALGRAIRTLPLPAGRPIHVYGGTPDSISFYAGIPLEERTQSVGDYLRSLAAEARSGRTFLLIRKDQQDELTDRSIPYRPQAAQGKWLMVEVQPE